MSGNKPSEIHEEGVEVPYEKIDRETLRNMIEEFVTRDINDWGDVSGDLENKIAQVMRQLKNRKARIVFDLKSETANIVTGT